MSLIQFSPADPQEAAIRERVKAFVDRKVRPVAIEDDEECRFRRSFFDELAKEKLTALAIPKEHGGAGLSSRCYYACLEELARGSLALSITIGVTNLIQGALAKFGNADQKDRYLKRLTSGEWLGAFSLSENQAGSDAASLRLSATKVGGGYRLRGTKMWCSNGGDADFYLVMGRTSPDRAKGITSFLVSKDAPGFRIGKQENKLGLRASSLAELIFEDCFVPDADRLGSEGEGLSVALSQLDSGRIAIGVAGLGIAIEALERVWNFWIKGNEGIPEGSAQELADPFALAQALRYLVAEAADQRDKSISFTTLASQIKLLGSDLAVKTSSFAVTLMGERGYIVENEVERLLRDAKSLQIVEGTNQIQRLVLARAMESSMRGAKKT